MVAWDIPEGQESVVSADFDECSEISGFSTMGDKSSMSQAQLEALYEQEVAEHECILALGLESDAPPSLQTYIDTYQTENQYYGMLPGLDSLSSDQASYAKAALACPPPTWYMNLPSG
ncbi:MAG: hypothetical protein QM677_08585 [Microbacterium sp.]